MTKDSSTAVAVAAVAGTIGLILAVRWNESAVRRAEKENLKQYHELPPGLAMSKDLIAANDERAAGLRVERVKKKQEFGRNSRADRALNPSPRKEGDWTFVGAARIEGKIAAAKIAAEGETIARRQSAVARAIAAFGTYESSDADRRLLEAQFRQGGTATDDERESFKLRHAAAYADFLSIGSTVDTGAGVGVVSGIVMGPHARAHTHITINDGVIPFDDESL